MLHDIPSPNPQVRRASHRSPFDSEDCLATVQGIPFLDDTFADRRLLAAVAAVRHVEAERSGLACGVLAGEAEVWLAPSRAFMLRDPPPIPAVPLSQQHKQRKDAALETLAFAMPAWRPLLRLPVRVALLDPPTGAISASSRAWPQHVLLSEDAFADDRELCEQLLHEMCHQWWYLIEEIWALNGPAATSSAVLPSGTAGRSPSEVLGAAHVATALMRWYRVTEPTSARISTLAAYADGCLDRVDTPNLTPAGRQLAHRLQEAR